jgi:hypothetical protein
VSHLERFMSFKPLLGMAFRLSSPPVLAERFTRVMCPPGPRMLGWVAKTLARRQHDEYLKSIHRVWHYIPEAPESVSFHTLKFLSRIADVNFDRVIEHLSTSDIMIVDGTRISRKSGLAPYPLANGAVLPDRMQRTLQLGGDRRNLKTVGDKGHEISRSPMNSIGG